MTVERESGLLTSRDAGPVQITNRGGRSRFLLLGDHAGNSVPERLHGLGLDPVELSRHISFDIGVSELGQQLGTRLDAPFVVQRYSRLVIDCNRSLSDPDSIAGISDGTPVPGNERLSEADRLSRAEEVFYPYHRAISDIIAEIEANAQPPIIVSLHSFTQQLTTSRSRASRPWQIGILYGGGDERFARTVLAQLRERGDLVVGDNEPYAFDGSDYTVPHHAFARARPYVEIEVRQDQLSAEGRAMEISTLLGAALAKAANTCFQT